MSKNNRIMHIQDSTGDTQVDLDTDVDVAKELFTEAIANGKMAYAYYESEKDPVFVRDFDELETATKVVVTPRQVGG